MNNGRHLIKTILFSVFFLFILNNVLAQSEKTMLWKISGKSLKKPSYLFGTMHLSDPRVFNTGDSVLLKIEECEAFSNEVYLDSLVSIFYETVTNTHDSMQIREYNEEVETEMEMAIEQSEIGNDFNRKALKKMNPSLVKYFASKNKSTGQMPTNLDFFLYGIAKKQNKTIVAVEDIKDQTSLFEKLSPESQKDFIKTEINTSYSYFDDLIDIYSKKDLVAIDSMMRKTPQELFDLTVVFRNKKMAGNIDSLINVRSTFIAVGAAHLPGNYGLIELLRNIGYTVTPVYSEPGIDWLTYSNRLPDIKWEVFTDSTTGYLVNIPVKPVPMDILFEDMKMQLSIDLINGLLYISFGRTLPMLAKEDEDGFIDNFISNFKAKGKVVIRQKSDPEKRYTLRELELTNIKNEKYLINVIISNSTFYMLMTGGINREIGQKESERFFNSFKTFEFNQKTWRKFTPENGSFEVMLPENPYENSVPTPVDDGNIMNVSQVISSDNKDGNSYIIQYLDGRGQYYDSDSLFFSSILESMKTSLNSRNTKSEVSEFLGLPARDYYFYLPDNTIAHLKAFLHGSRAFLLFAIYNEKTKNSSGITSFFNSFRLSEINCDNHVQQMPKDSSFSILGPARLFPEAVPSYSSTIDSITYYYSYDRNSGQTWYASKITFLPYTYFVNDSCLVSDITNSHLNYNDSVLYEKKDSVLHTYEFITKSETSSLKKYLYSVVSGKNVYSVFFYLNELSDPEPIKKTFFESLKILKPDTTNLFVSKAAMVLRDVASTDTTVSYKAVLSLTDYPFTKSDLQMIHNALCIEFADDTLGYNSTREKLFNSIGKLKDERSVNFIDSLYPFLKKHPDIQSESLSALSQIKTRASYETLKKHLLNDRPVDYPFWFYELNSDSLALSMILFPEAFNLISDTIYCDYVLFLSDQLLDSGIMNPEMLQPFKDLILEKSNNDLLLLKKYDKYDYYTIDILNVLANLKTEESIPLLKEFCKTKNLWAKFGGVKGLIHAGAEPSKKDMDIIYKNDLLRLYLYEYLKRRKKADQFDQAYLKNVFFAASHLISSMNEGELAPVKLTHIGQFEKYYKGKKSIFYVFKYDSDGYYGDYKYAFFCGPYDPDGKLNTEMPEINDSSWEDYNPDIIESELDQIIKSYDR